MTKTSNGPSPPKEGCVPAPVAEPASRILIVDDDEDTRLMLRTFLEMEHFEVLEAADGETAFDTAVRQTPDLILMDLSLPIVDGLETTQLIRRHRLIGKVPIIFLSGRAEPIQRQAALSAGGDDFLVKPIDVDKLLEIVGRWLPPQVKALRLAG
jgi:two-component system cell cycle response regulator DivK